MKIHKLSAFELKITLILAVNQVNIVESAVYDLIRTLLQWNVAGIPLIHERREFDFDPDISIKRRQLFYEVTHEMQIFLIIF